MSGKRQAVTDLNHENWDQDEEPEERGTFRSANETELKNRVIKKAKRQITATNVDGAEKKSIFSGFSGFGKAAPAGVASSSPFSFLSKNTATATTASATAAPVTSNVSKSATDNFTFEKSSCYYGKVKKLNEAVAEWIKSHVDKNPICILTPIFKDYDRYLNDIENEEKTNKFKVANNSQISVGNVAPSTNSTAFSGFKFSSIPTTEQKDTIVKSTSEAAASSSINANNTFSGPPKTNGINIESNSNQTVQPPAKQFTFMPGMSTAPTDGSGDGKPKLNFAFNSTATAAPAFSFGNIKAQSSPTETGANDNAEEEDEPPKAVFTQVVEEGAVYSKKCKVYVKKNDSFGDRGVGTVYLKPIKETGKTQLLVRADTNLGNILVNLILNTAIPSKRMGKKDVMLVCLPTPEDSKPTSMLLRVKSGEDADNLLEAIEKYKK